MGTTYVEAIYGGHGQLRGLDVERGVPGGQRARDHLGPHLVAEPVHLRHLGDLHRHRLGITGTPGGTVTFYSCTTTACSTKTSLGDGDAQVGQGHLLDLGAPGGHNLRRGRLHGASGNYGGSTVQRGEPGGQRARDHLGPHLVAQPVELRLLGHLHRHCVGSARSGTPAGTVTFYSCTTNTCRARPRSARGL